ncbi:unnamed protein product [Nezara viridula]|uniref:Uncharacterized protein n=1 Tax=Nezara viridula TaxID=85310 RepID=A0A9P0MQ24_NEZVI|nr:unnamed protein product [Nezara viridula]
MTNLWLCGRRREKAQLIASESQRRLITAGAWLLLLPAAPRHAARPAPNRWSTSGRSVVFRKQVVGALCVEGQCAAHTTAHSSHAATCVRTSSSILNLWRVVVPRGGPEPPQQPPQGPEFWGYAPPWPQPHHPQPQRPSLKRSHSESDDQDDPFSEESSKDQ